MVSFWSIKQAKQTVANSDVLQTPPTSQLLTIISIQDLFLLSPFYKEMLFFFNSLEEDSSCPLTGVIQKQVEYLTL